MTICCSCSFRGRNSHWGRSHDVETLSVTNGKRNTDNRRIGNVTRGSWWKEIWEMMKLGSDGDAQMDALLVFLFKETNGDWEGFAYEERWNTCSHCLTVMDLSQNVTSELHHCYYTQSCLGQDHLSVSAFPSLFLSCFYPLFLFAPVSVHLLFPLQIKAEKYTLIWIEAAHWVAVR